MVRWHHRLSGHEFKQTLGASGGQRRLVHCSPWGHNELDLATEQHFSSGEGVSVSSAAQSCLTLCDPMDCSMPNFIISRSFLTFMSIESVMPSNHLILCHPLLLLPSIFPSIRVFSNESAHQVTKILELQFQHKSFQ